MKEFNNPENFFIRFLMNFVLGYSAILVSWLIVGAARGEIDWFFFALATLAFGILFGLLRAAISKPGTSFWSSPVRHYE